MNKQNLETHIIIDLKFPSPQKKSTAHCAATESLRRCCQCGLVASKTHILFYADSDPGYDSG